MIIYHIHIRVNSDYSLRTTHLYIGVRGLLNVQMKDNVQSINNLTHLLETD